VAMPETEKLSTEEPAGPTAAAIDSAAAFAAHADQKVKASGGVLHAIAEEARKGGHYQKAKFTAKLYRLLKDPLHKKKADRLIKNVNAKKLGPEAADVRKHKVDDKFKQEHGRGEIKAPGEGFEDLVVAFGEAKTAIIHDLTGWAKSTLTLKKVADDYAVRISTLGNQYTWMQQLTGGRLIVEDAEGLPQIAIRIEQAFNQQIIGLAMKIGDTMFFEYDDKLGGGDEDACYEANRKKQEAKIKEMEREQARIKQLTPDYSDFADVLKAAATHVDSLVDDEGWKAVQIADDKDRWDYLISGVDIVLEGLAGAIANAPFPGAGATAKAVQGAIGKITRWLNVLRRNAKIEDLKKAVKNTPSGKVNDDARRKFYLAELDRNKALMAKRVLDIQKMNIHDMWTGISIPMAEIPVPGVADIITGLGEGICSGWYELQVNALEDSLKGDTSIDKNKVKEFVVDAAVDVGKDVIESKFKDKLADAVTAIIGKGETLAKQFAAWLADRLGDVAGAVKDLAIDGLKSLLISLCASLVARLLHWFGGSPMAQEIGSGDLASIINESNQLRDEVDNALADLPS
jgi:hypothetical protein